MARNHSLLLQVLESRLMLSASPAFLRAIGSVVADQATAVVAQADGNMIVGGNFRKTIALGTRRAPFSLSSAGSTDGFVASYSPAGRLNWAFSVGGAGADSVSGLAVLPDGTFCVSGSFEGWADFAPGAAVQRFKSAGRADAFVARYSATGQFAWAAPLGGAGTDVASGVAFDPDGNVLTVGSFIGHADFDPGRGVSSLDAISNRIFVSKLSAEGRFIWARSPGVESHLGNDEGRAIGADRDGNVIVAGATTTDRTMKDFKVDELHNAIVAKLSPAGSTLWEQTFLGGGDDIATALAIDGSGSAYVTGILRGTLNARLDTILRSEGGTDSFVMKLASGGQVAWAAQFGGAGNERGQSISLDIYGQVLCAGSFARTADFCPGRRQFTLASAGDTDAYLTKLSTDGKFLSAERFGGRGVDSALAIFAAPTHTILAGVFSRSASFDPATAIISSAGDTDGFVAELFA